MKVRFFGFTLDVVSKNLTHDQWAAYEDSKRLVLPDIAGANRFFLIDNTTNSDYSLGLVVTVKDQRKLCQLIDDAGGFKVRVSDIEEGSSLLDFNFFVINKASGTGLYQHYHQSCSVPSFGRLLSRSFNEFKKFKCESAFAALPTEEQTDKKRLKIGKENAGRLKWTQLVRQEALDALLQELSRIKSFEYVLSTPTVEEDEFRPLSPYLTTKSSRLVFGVGTPKGLIVESIASYVRSGDAKSGHIEGEDDDGNPRSYSILENPDNFGEYEYDHVADQLNELDLGNFQDSWVIQELLSACATHSHIIEAPRRP